MAAASPMLTFVLGCTASGKGAAGRELANRLGGEIISVDSMKVYRRMDIGTAKPTARQRNEVPHHLIDVVEPSEEFSVAQYVANADQAIADISQRGKPIFVVGGTPLYVKGLTEGLFEGPGADPEIRQRLRARAQLEGPDSLYSQLQRVDPTAAERIHVNDLRRTVRALEVYELTGRPISELQQQWNQQESRYNCRFIGLRRSREEQSQRTNARVRRMIEMGLVDEVRALLGESEPLSDTARKAVGYAEIIDHLEGRISLADAVEMIKISTRQLAKAQRTWFKRFPDVHWMDLAEESNLLDVTDNLLKHLAT